MKILCDHPNAIPDLERIIALAQHEHLVLEFPKVEMSPALEAKLISELKEKLPENYSVFKSGVWKESVTITIKAVLSASTIKQHIGLILAGIKDYLHLSKILLHEVQQSRETIKGWELVEEHGEHYQFQNNATGQILETSAYPITDLDSIDPYFWGLFIETSKKHVDLKGIIKDTFHDSCRILKFVENDNELREQVTVFFNT